MTACRAFLSYHKKNIIIANRLCTEITNLLEEHGIGPEMFELWYDKNLKAGDRWDKNIEGAINTSDIILFLVTPSSVQATYMWTDELTIAIDRFRSGSGSYQ